MPQSFRQAAIIYDSGTVAAGAAIDSGAIDTISATEIGISVLNYAGDATRALGITYLDGNGNAISGAVTAMSVNAATNAIGGISGSGPGGTNQLAITPSPKMKFTVAAAGTGSLRIIIWGR